MVVAMVVHLVGWLVDVMAGRWVDKRAGAMAVTLVGVSAVRGGEGRGGG